ncbi:phospholipid scramblase 2 [Dermacentor silvarum]|uniref:phospholipid scramblase 2 n=1 Tax=Dermacentor silvarum TaxID=543639 RepID=UPI0021016EB7|nr:phospholipid scramblase 2 [Dermacentor silvarum]
MPPKQTTTGKQTSGPRRQSAAPLQAPPAPPGIVCAPGLEYLALVDQIIIQQQVELLEAILHYETCNAYVAKNSMGQFMYNIAENSSCMARCCCGPKRPFEMDVFDYRNVAVMHFVRPLRCVHCCYCCCLQEMQVQAPPGKVVASVVQKWSMCYPTFVVNDRNQRRVLDIVGPLCTASIPCKCDVDFEVRSTNGVVIGKITKQWSGLARELFTDADTFGVTFPLDLDVHVKGALIAATMLIDYLFFEETHQKGGDDVLPGMAA